MVAVQSVWVLPVMVRFITPTVEVSAPDGSKSLWLAALPYDEAVAAVRRLIPTDHVAELSVVRVHLDQKLLCLRRGEVRKLEQSLSKLPSDLTQSAKAINNIAMGHVDYIRARSMYRAYTVVRGGKLIGLKLMLCRNDDEAIVKAIRLTTECDIEVWNGERFVIRLIRKPKKVRGRS
jgi:hypothetical protein